MFQVNQIQVNNTVDTSRNPGSGQTILVLIQNPTYAKGLVSGMNEENLFVH